MDELARLKALYDLEILDTPAEESFDDIVKLATSICGTPLGAISLVDRDRQWFKSKIGFPASETPRSVSLCQHVVGDPKLTIIEDARLDRRFSDNPAVQRENGIRFYAGAPLQSPDGLTYGTLCVVDTKPRTLSEEKREALTTLASQVVRLFEYRKLIRLKKERQAREEELHRSLKRLFNHCPFLMGIVELRGEEIVHLSDNLATEQFFSAATDGLVNRATSELGVRREDIDVWRSAILASQRTGSPVSYGYEYRSNGPTKYLEVVVWHIGDSPAGHPQFSYAADDVTGKRERTLTIQRQRAQMIENAKLSSIGEMAAGIAHEINNPLTIIDANLQLLANRIQLGTAEPPHLLERLGVLRSTCERIAKIISGLRALSRSGDQDTFVTAGAARICSDTLEFCRERFRHHNIELTVEASHAQLWCRPVQISQVLLNLLNNAFDAVAGQPRAWVKVETSVSVDGRVLIAVSDSGPRIPDSVQARMMNPFFTTKPVGKGSGLGLSIARGIAESHGGSLIFDASAPCTRFILELPAARELPAVAGR